MQLKGLLFIGLLLIGNFVNAQEDIKEEETSLFKVSLTPVTGYGMYIQSKFHALETGTYISLWSPRTNKNINLKTGVVYGRIFKSDVKGNVIRFPVQFQYTYKKYKLQPEFSVGTNILFSDTNIANGIFHTISLNTGLNYKLTETTCIGTWLNTDYTPYGRVILDDKIDFEMVSWSINVGIRIDL